MKSDSFAGLERALVGAVIICFAFPFFISLPLRIPGLQGLTPHKVLLPLLVPFALVRWQTGAIPRAWRRPATLLFGAFVAWAAVTAFAGPRTLWLHNARHLAWLGLAFIFLLEAEAVLETRVGCALVTRTVAVTGAFICLFGYAELISGSYLDWFYGLFRPSAVAPDVLRTVTPPPLPLHMTVAGRRSLSSTYSSPFTFALFAVWAFERLARQEGAGPRPAWRRLTGALLAIGAAGIVPLSASRMAVGQILVGIPTAAVLLSLRQPSQWRRFVGRSIIVLCGVGVIAQAASSVLMTKLASLRDVPAALRMDNRAESLRRPDLAATASTQRREGSELRRLGTAGLRTALPTKGSADSARSRGPVAGLPTMGQEASEVRRPAAAGLFSAIQRLRMIRVAFAMAKANPVFGVGFASYRPLLYSDPGYVKILGFRDSGEVLDVYDAHSFPVTTLATMGVVGIMLLALLAYVSIRGLIRAFGRPEGQDAATAGLSVAAACAVGMAASFTLVDPMSCVLFALLIASGVATEEAAYV